MCWTLVPETGLCRSYFEDRLRIAEDEVDGAFDVAILEVMSSSVIEERVLSSIHPAPVESRLVSCK